MELKILILDDEYIILDGLCSFPWEMYGCRIVGKAMDGEEGMELIDRYQPDIILSDIKMPEKDGIQVAKYAKEKYPDTEIDVYKRQIRIFLKAWGRAYPAES